MSNWRVFPKRGWSPVGQIVSGFGQGEGSYGMAYAIDDSSGRFLNGRVAARVRIAANLRLNGAGVICRADELRSFAAFYVISDQTAQTPEMYSVRLAAFKYGKLDVLVGLKTSIHIPKSEFQIALQFFSGDLVGQVHTGLETYTLRHLLAMPPFPGYSGIIRFYNSSATVQDVQIERITMNAKLPEDGETLPGKTYKFDVFLSHSTADKPTVLKVVEALKESGIRYWIDNEQITFGDGIISKIEEGLRDSKYVVVCLSDKFAGSGWCRAEYGPILYREFSGNSGRKVIPLSLDGSQNGDSVPLLLSDKLRADFLDPRSFGALLKFLGN